MRPMTTKKRAESERVLSMFQVQCRRETGENRTGGIISPKGLPIVYFAIRQPTAGQTISMA